MNENILRENVQNFINENIKTDVNAIALGKQVFSDVSSSELAGQILSKQKAEKKLPTWFHAKNIYYPRPLSIEQTSSEVTARYKASIIIGNSVLDLTGGFGVDSYYFSKKSDKVVHCEIDEDLSKIADHNAKTLNATNIIFVAEDGLQYLKSSKNHWDTIFIDPARRTTAGKVFKVEDCTPNIIEHLPFLLEKANRIVIKTSPLLDFTVGLTSFKNVKEIHVISVKNECKELLWVLEKGWDADVSISAISLNESDKTYSFLRGKESNVSLNREIFKGLYLYEPDVAVLKSGGQDLLAAEYKLNKLAQNTQLYTSERLEPNFIGRIFIIENVIDARELKKSAELKANVIVRNYPAKAEELSKKYSIKSSKNVFLIFCKTADEKNIIIAAKILQYY